MNSLVALVKSVMVDAHPEWSFSTVESESESSFDNAFVVLQSNELRLRVLRDRGTVFLDIGSLVEPSTWFDSAVVADWLSLSDSGGIHGSDVPTVLASIAELMRGVGLELRDAFSASRFAAVKAQLIKTRDARAARLFKF
jgi:hypothetical protein